jgi:hypothetical protein|tara:strand:- start:3068 stop:3256 length:189 start_codon:yes stop_codon:yes gene_type:complete
MFGKSASWWFGKNSIFGQAVRQTKYGADQGSYTSYINGSSNNEADILKYGILFGLFFLLAKK